jgi:two-component system, chemotaxis family, protein-glutamate methylesterase/glutaminase
MSKRLADQQIRVLVVEDSRAQRELLVGLLQTTGEFVVAGTASNGQEAIDATLRLRPDIVAMDIHLPVLDGYDATRQIMRRCPTPIVMVSGSDGDMNRRSVEALAAGALAVVRKPAGAGQTNQEERAMFLTTLRLMAGVRVVTRHPPRVQAPAPPTAPSTSPLVLAIAASTGGPAAVQMLLSGLGKQFPLPILVAQHIASGFAPALADWLNATIPLQVGLAEPEERLLPGHVYLAPDDYHLMVRDRLYAALRPVTPQDRFCPSADLLFESVAKSYGPRAIGLVLTGMGDDGTLGLRALRAGGAQTLAQDEASCVVYGMPRAAVAAGVITGVVPLNAMADVILRRISHAGVRSA